MTHKSKPENPIQDEWIRLRDVIRQAKALSYIRVPEFNRLVMLLGHGNVDYLLDQCQLSKAEKKSIREKLKEYKSVNELLSAIKTQREVDINHTDRRPGLDRKRYNSRRESYSARFHSGDVARLRSGAVSARDANRYPPVFDSQDIVWLHKGDINPKEALRYGWRFEGEGIYKLFCARVPPNVARKYDKRFSADEIISLVKKHIKPVFANRYESRFNADDIALLLDESVEEKTANRFYREFTAQQILILLAVGIDPRTTSMKQQRKLFPVFSKVASYGSVSKEPESFSLIGTGASAVVMLSKGSAWKFSKRINDEYRFLRKVESVHKGRQHHVVKLKGEPQHGFVLELQYVEGKSLEQILEAAGPLAPEKVLHYGEDVCKGILELRQAGIYHRDLHDRNVIIDASDDSAIIIDLGVATDDSHSVYKGNRAYGGNNDLISLGQLLYKLAVGNNLFKEGPGSTYHTVIKENVKTIRSLTYLMPEQLAKVLESVRGDIPHPPLADMVTYLLDDDLWTQPSKEKVEEALAKFGEVRR